MTGNASHVVVHHHFDNASDAKLISLTCCIVLSVVVVLILLIILAIIIYMLSQRTRHNPQDLNPAVRTNDTLPRTTRNRTASTTFKGETSSNIRRGIVNPAASFEDSEIDINSNGQRLDLSSSRQRLDINSSRQRMDINSSRQRMDINSSRQRTDINSDRQSIPMATFRVDNCEHRQVDSSESSAGLCEVLFPQQHEGEVIREPPPKVVAFAGRVYATSRRNSRPPPESQHSGSGTRHKSVNSTALEWDYHESRLDEESNDSETDRRDTVDICWV